jgi:hypothetical protein
VIHKKNYAQIKKFKRKLFKVILKKYLDFWLVGGVMQ